jgi:hypothetical protein
MQQTGRFLFGLWLALAALQSFALNIDGNPVFYYYLVQVLAIGFGALAPAQPINSSLRLPLILLCAFLVVAAVGAIALPILFEGTPAFAPRISIDEQMLGMTPVRLSISNFVQAVYLATNVTIVFFAAQGRYGDLAKPFRIGALVAAAIISSSMYAEFAEVGIWTNYLSDILRNNEAAALLDNLKIDNVRRIAGTFSEPSYAGAFSGALATYFLTEYLEGRRTYDLIIAVVMMSCAILTTSLLGFSALLIGLGLIVFRYIRKYFFLFILAMIALVGLYYLIGAEFVDRIYLNRSGDSSFNRLSSDARSIEIFFETHMIGVGIGSHRASSLISTIIGCTGLLGASLYLAALIKLLTVRVSPDRQSAALPIRNFATTFWLASLSGLAELSTPMLWTAVVGLIGVAATRTFRTSSGVAVSNAAVIGRVRRYV